MPQEVPKTFSQRFKPLITLGVFLAVATLSFSIDVDYVQAGASKCDTVTWDSGGTIDTAEDAPSTNFYSGAWFRGTCNAATGNGDATISGITVTVNDATGLSNMDIYRDNASSCSTADPTGATLFGSNSTVGATTAITGTEVMIENEQSCFYVILDIGAGAADQQTLDISINSGTDISNDVTTAGSFPLNPTGETTISSAGGEPYVPAGPAGQPRTLRFGTLILLFGTLIIY